MAFPRGLRFMSVRDIGLFRRSARSDARLKRLLAGGETRAGAFDRLYAEARDGDPWASGSPRYRYQSFKYDALIRLLPTGRRFGSSLDAGCGAGLLSQRLAGRSEAVLGIDVSAVAVTDARRRGAGYRGLSFEQADLLALPADYDNRFDLVVLADSIYYLPEAHLTAPGLATLATGLARLLRPGGLLLVANHYFWTLDGDSRLTRRIDDAFRASRHLKARQGWRRPFWLASLFEQASPPLSP